MEGVLIEVPIPEDMWKKLCYIAQLRGCTVEELAEGYIRGYVERFPEKTSG